MRFPIYISLLPSLPYNSRRDGSVVFVPTSHTDGRDFEPSTRSQPVRLGEMVEQQDYAGPRRAVLGKFPAPGLP